LISSSSGKRPVSRLEKIVFPSRVTSKTPPPDGSSVSSPIRVLCSFSSFCARPTARSR
jgi:hypothetical protein